MQKLKTLVNKLNVPAGSHVIFEDTKREANTGKTGQLLCTVPNGGSLFYKKDELELMT